jgi:oxygen-independent coproporphyrinogen-3 oxidase
MTGLYIHIPFCARRCPYCDFAVHIGPALHHKYLQVLHNELRRTLGAHFAAFPGDSIGTIFCGGGTPTSIGAAGLNSLLHTIRECARLDSKAEITLEGNPEDASPALFAELRAAGWNRLSLGVQSLDDSVLQVLGRRHTRADVERAVVQVREAGFENISLDLIYAVPGQDAISWRDTLQQAMEMNTTHLSCYSLTIEPGTAFGRRVEKKRMHEVEDDTQAEQMEAAHQVLEGSGLERYEVSNYARPGFECQHNLRTWRGGNYLACGNGAHGHLDGHRWWNKREVPAYIQGMQNGGTARAGEEFLTRRQRLDELVLMGLRLREGFDFQGASARAGFSIEGAIGRKLQALVARGDLERGQFWDVASSGRRVTLEEGEDGEHYRKVWQQDNDGPRVRLSPSKWALADAVALDVLS